MTWVCICRMWPASITRLMRWRCSRRWTESTNTSLSSRSICSRFARMIFLRLVFSCLAAVWFFFLKHSLLVKGGGGAGAEFIWKEMFVCFLLYSQNVHPFKQNYNNKSASIFWKVKIVVIILVLSFFCPCSCLLKGEFLISKHPVDRLAGKATITNGLSLRRS